MKKTLLILILAVITLSCSKDDENVTEQSVDISNTEIYEYDLGSFGIEDGARINIQAENYEISELNRDNFSQIILCLCILHISRFTVWRNFNPFRNNLRLNSI